MTGAPETRTTHVIRILGTNKKGDVLPDIWADVERIDRAKYVTQTNETDWQGVVRKFRWLDDPDSAAGVVEPRSRDGIAINPDNSRDVITVKVCSPDEKDLNDPEEWIPIDAVRHLRAKDSVQGQVDSHINEELTAARSVNKRRVFHRDTSIDKDAQAAFDADPTRKVYVVQGADYRFINSANDDRDQYVEHEVVTRLKGLTNDKTDVTSSSQGVTIKLLNQYLIDQTDEAKLKEVGKNDINPPYRLEPYQNIVNVQLTSPQQAVLGISDVPITVTRADSTTQISKDGTAWQAGFAGSASNAATGLGHTVVCAGNKYIAFGKPRDGGACFIVASASEVQRGVLNDQGDLVWTSVTMIDADISGNFISGAQSCSFAGGAFFIGYFPASPSDNDHQAVLAVSFDGVAFAKGIAPFVGVSDAAAGSGFVAADISLPVNAIGSVAYKKIDETTRRYVVTGSFGRKHTALFTITSDLGSVQLPFTDTESNFMSAVSADGFSWSPLFDTSEVSGDDGAETGIGGPNAPSPATLCYGNGVFVAAAGKKTRQLIGPPDGGLGTYLWQAQPVCSVAISSDGRSWTNRRLPEAVVTEKISGTTACVGFFRTRGKFPNGDPKGFFVAAGLEGGTGETSVTRLWTSDDGSSWNFVRKTDSKFEWILSAINRSRGTVVTR